MRLVTRSDFDGLACGAMLKDLGVINSWEFVHPQDLQDGWVKIGPEDALVNMPYVPGCGLWFDCHEDESGAGRQVEGARRAADSTAEIIYDYYGGEDALPHFADMVRAVSDMEAMRMTADEILHPAGWFLLGFIMDPRTGLGRFQDFRISNYDLMELLMDDCRTQPIEKLLELLDVQERIELYMQHDTSFREMLHTHTRVEGGVLITDLRGSYPIFSGNRYLIYCLYPEAHSSIWVVDGRGKLNCPIEAGRSAINHACKADIGALMRRYGGSGRSISGTCQVPYEQADSVIADLAARLREGGE